MLLEKLRVTPNARITISASPSPSPYLLASPSVSDSLPSPLSGRGILTLSGRHAIWNALKVLSSAPEHNVLMPSYHCGSQVTPMKRYPVQIKFYRVLRSLEIDLDHLVQTIDHKTKAVLVTHYFGFPQDIDAVLGLCKERGLYLIEDCAHSLYGTRNGRWLGTSGDLGVFSLRKTLPLPDGGALLINNPALRFTGSLVRPPLDAYLGGVKELLQIYARSHLGGVDVAEFWAVKRTIEGIKRYRKRMTGIEYSLGGESFEPVTGEYEASWITKALLKRVRGEEVMRRRRQNYLFLLEHLDGMEGASPVRRDLPEGVCPLYFPLRVPDSTEYGRCLKASGIEAIPFWSHRGSLLRPDLFEDTLSLKKTVLALPIHQDLTPRHVRKIADALREVLSHRASK